MSGLINGRYRVQSRLGAGAMGTVDLAADLAREGALVALKRVTAGGDASALTREFETLARLRHPNLPAVHDFGRIEETDSLFISMDYVKGSDLLAAASSLTPPQALDVTAQICRALEFIHTRGLVHRDLKPENILVTMDGGLPRAFLVDFGLASTAREEALLRGTLHYLAPEVLRKERVDRRADLYALGVILYRLAAGRLPFEGDPREVLQGHVERAPRSPLEGPGAPGSPAPLRPVLDEALASVILRLLEKDPARRYRSAAETLRSINRATGTQHPIETPETGSSYSAFAPLVGREREMAALEAILARRGRPPSKGGVVSSGANVVLVAGEAGAGKSRFLLEAKRRAQLLGSIGALATCGADRPALHAVSEAASLLGASPAGPPDTDDAAPSPERARLKIVDAAPSPERARLKIVDAAAASIAARISTTPAVLLFDDAHLADDATLDVIEALGRSAYGVKQLTLVLSYRPEECEGTGFLGRIDHLRRHSAVDEIALSPLDEARTRELVSGMLGLADPPASLVELIHRETSGNPFFIEQAVGALLEDGTISRVGTDFRADVDALTKVAFPTGAGEAVRRRLARVAPDEHRLMEALSVIARPADRALLVESSGLSAEAAAAALTSLHEKKLVVQSPSDAGTLHAIANNRTREFVYEGIDWSERSALHGRVATALKSTPDDGGKAGFIELARHFMNGPDPAAALAHALDAASRSETLGASGDAIAFYRRALELLPADGGAERAEIHWKIGVAERALGHDAAAVESFESSLRAAAGSARKDLAARARVEKAGMHIRRGRLEEAVREIDTAREMIGPQGDPVLLTRTYSLLASVLGRSGKMDRALETQKQALAFAEKAGSKAAHAAALNNLGMIHCVMGRHEEGFRALEEAIGIRRSAGDRNGELETTGNLGMLLAGNGEAQRALPHLDSCRTIARETGDLLALVEADINLGTVHLTLGQHDLTAACLEEAAAVALRVGDDARASNALDVWGASLRTAGDHEAALEKHTQALECARRSEDAVQERFALGSLAIDHAVAARVPEGRDLLRRADRLPGGAPPPRARLRLAEASARVHLAAGDADEALKGAREMIEIARQERLVPDEARGLWLLGSALASRNDVAGARSAFDQSAERSAFVLDDETRWSALAGLAEIAKKSGEAALSKATLKKAAEIIGTLAARIADEDLRRRYVSSPERSQVLKSAGPLPGAEESLRPTAGGALAAIYRMSEIVTSGAHLDDLLSEVLDLALQIVHAERGLVILLDEEDGERQEVRAARGVEPETIADALEYSRNVVKEAAAGSVIVTIDAGTDQRFRRFESVGLFHIKSLACVPMKVRNRVLGSVYLDSREQGYLFREEDVEFLKAFANLAAGAIEMARLNAALSSENVTLRREVQDLRKAAVKRARYQALVGKTVRMQAIYDLLDRVSGTMLPVLITGESGTGKELVARALHFGGPRKDRKFFSENVAAIPGELLESELFGHMRGSFTGADRDRKGVFELANGGTLFLDEIGDMSLPLQSKVLRALQEGEIRPVGGKDPVKVDVRVISATNRDLETMVRDGRFREDLYYRLNVVRIPLPPLRERKEDIPLLIEHFLDKASRPAGSPTKRFDIAALQLLLRYDWPGNVRELENEITKLSVLCPREVITQSDLAECHDLMEKLTRLEREGEEFQNLQAMEKRQIERALAEAGGNRVRAAQLLGISRATIYRKLKDYGIDA